MENEIGRSTALMLPDEATFRHDIQAINRFQQVVHSCMVENLDYGIIPGTTKPTLLKPGAEKIAKLLGLSDQYEILDSKEDWQLPFFRYLIKCRLVHVATGVIISEGMGECNSYESKYRYRWVGERDLPASIDKNSLVTQERKSTKTGGHWTVYRIDNDDIFGQVNTILKMAKKRALVDAALSAGRLSDVFTQDIEDIPSMARQDFTIEKASDRARAETKAPQDAVDKSEHYCHEHDTPYFMKGKMKGYAHKLEGTDQWCNESPEATADAVTTKSEPSPEQSNTETQDEPTATQKLKSVMRASGYSDGDVQAHMILKYKKAASKELTPAQLKELTLDVVNYQIPKTQKEDASLEP